MNAKEKNYAMDRLHNLYSQRKRRIEAEYENRKVTLEDLKGKKVLRTYIRPYWGGNQVVVERTYRFKDPKRGEREKRLASLKKAFQEAEDALMLGDVGKDLLAILQRFAKDIERL